ncbi:MAG TPA: universal stress protein [Longimicrobiaceae bacterium]|nr:universal stress protein [Longimicrobiaceae bacterium]
MKSIESILVATDLSESSDHVLRAAAALADLTGAKLHVLHAFDLQILPYTEENLRSVGFAERIRDAEQALEAQIRRTVRPHVEVADRAVMIYLAHKAISEQARAVDADLIVLGAHRKRPLGDALLGSTADRVIRSAEVPCLVVRGPLSLPLRRVLVPLDLSEPAVGALDVALAWSDALRPSTEVAPLGPRVTVLHVIPLAFDLADFPLDRAVIGPELHREVEAARGRVPGARALEVREEVCWGDLPAEEILRVAEQDRADLLVLATHGFGAVKRALIGSVASSVARAASCPVLLVPPGLWKAEPAGETAA